MWPGGKVHDWHKESLGSIPCMTGDKKSPFICHWWIPVIFSFCSIDFCNKCLYSQRIEANVFKKKVTISATYFQFLVFFVVIGCFWVILSDAQGLYLVLFRAFVRAWGTKIGAQDYLCYLHAREAFYPLYCIHKLEGTKNSNNTSMKAEE